MLRKHRLRLRDHSSCLNSRKYSWNFVLYTVYLVYRFIFNFNLNRIISLFLIVLYVLFNEIGLRPVVIRVGIFITYLALGCSKALIVIRFFPCNSAKVVFVFDSSKHLWLIKFRLWGISITHLDGITKFLTDDNVSCLIIDLLNIATIFVVVIEDIIFFIGCQLCDLVMRYRCFLLWRHFYANLIVFICGLTIRLAVRASIIDETSSWCVSPFEHHLLRLVNSIEDLLCH